MSNMSQKITTKKINLYGKDTDPKNGVKNSYPTSHFAFRQVCIHMIVGQRGQGKSHSCSKLINQAQKEKIFDDLYLISPSAMSNKEYFGKFIPDENIYKPTKDSVELVISRVEQERDEFEEYMTRRKEYDDFIKILKSKKDFSDDEIIRFENLGFLGEHIVEPKWKHHTIRPPQSAVILDDVLGSALLKSKKLEQLFCTNRHIAPLQEPHSNRSACGLSIYILVQSYRCGGGGVPRLIRENLTELTLFKNKQKKQLDVIKDELASVIDENKFEMALDYATRKPFGHLTISFGNLACQTLTFREGFNNLIIFQDDADACQCH